MRRVSGYGVRLATPEDAAGIARVHVDSWRTTYRGIVPDGFLDQMSYTTSEARWRRIWEQNSSDYAMFVAEDEADAIVGFANGGRERSGDVDYCGELYAIYLLRDCQRQGIGQRLFGHVVGHLITKGFGSMLIWVLADNPSCYFYQKMAGVPVRESWMELGGKSLREIGYGWNDLSRLAASQDGGTL